MTKEELEKEAIAKYKTGSYPQLHPDVYAFVHGYLAGAEPRERENTELKLKLEALDGQTPWKEIKDKSEVIGKLTEAKGLLICFISKMKNSIYTPYEKDLVERAEQFLEELEGE